MAQRLNEEQIAEVIDMGNAGVSALEAAREMNVSVPTITTLYRKYGIVVDGVGRKKLIDRMDPDSVEYLVQEYEKNERPVSEIIEELGMSYGQLYNILRQLGVSRRKYGQERLSGHQARFDAAVEMYEEGEPLWRIKEETGVHQPQLHAELHRRGIELRRPRRKPD